MSQHIIENVLEIRQARQAKAERDYGAALLRFDTPQDGDGEALESAMTTLGRTISDVDGDCAKVVEFRQQTAKHEALTAEAASVASEIEQAKIALAASADLPFDHDAQRFPREIAAEALRNLEMRYREVDDAAYVAGERARMLRIGIPRIFNALAA